MTALRVALIFAVVCPVGSSQLSRHEMDVFWKFFKIAHSKIYDTPAEEIIR